MTRSITGECTTSVVNPWTDEEHEISVRVVLETGSDSVPWGSTYAQMPWSEVVEEQWTFDGQEVASWALSHHLHWHGVLPSQQPKFKERLVDRAMESAE